MKTILCISSYEKGQEFMRQCKKNGWRVLLLTVERLRDAGWPHDSLENIFYLPEKEGEMNLKDIIYGVSYLARSEQIDRIVALDDYDVEKAAGLREHLRVPGMGDTTARYFRDKLAMRARAKDVGIKVPDFIHVLNYNKINKFIGQNSFPLILKPRLHAGSIGVNKLSSTDELWEAINNLGDEQSFYLIEQFIEGDVFHVDTIVHNYEIKFAVAHEYGKPPMEVAHEGRVFTSKTMLRQSEDEKKLNAMNELVIKAMGLKQGISHTEFIKYNKNGEFYFLETSARVGGANIAELIEAATGINYWTEWAKIETMSDIDEYILPEIKNEYAGIIISLARQEYPDLSSYTDNEIYWRLNKKHHAGLIVKSENKNRVDELIDLYTQKFYNDFFTSQPMRDKPAS
ncbi:MAG: ATP-grasp domain-containing protein [Melioribacteraceae bacterium]|nr:ATP-grasp domain-containing protein [Melioribacteraceae bacterium]